jgi:hypothetical protein
MICVAHIAAPRHGDIGQSALQNQIRKDLSSGVSAMRN